MPLSAKQMEYLALAWQCFETEPKIDYTKFATVAGLKTPASARELMRVTKNKLKEEYGALSSNIQNTNSNTNSPAPKTPSKKVSTTPKATPASKKRARKAAEFVQADENDEEIPPASSKKAKMATSAPVEVVKKESEGTSEDDVSFL